MSTWWHNQNATGKQTIHTDTDAFNIANLIAEMYQRLPLSFFNLAPAAVMTAALVLALLSPPATAQQLYKWVEEDGTIRYSDRLPPDQRKKGHQTLSTQGRILETTEAATPPEELKRRRAEQKRLEEEARKKAEQEAAIQAEKDHHDRVLLMTFSNENEIIEVEKERVAVINSVINLLRKNSAQEQQKLEQLEQRAQRDYIDQDKAVPGGLAQNIEYFAEKIRGIEHQLELKQAEKERLKKQYAEDLIRYRELTKTDETN